jgi:hypothetical protein
MVKEGSPPVHGPHLEIDRWFPAEVAAGAELIFTVRVNCPFGCDLRGMEVVVEAPEGPLVTEKLVSWGEGSNATAEIVIRAPSEIGEHKWSVSYRHQASDPPEHTGISLPVPFSTVAHQTSLAVWDLPSPAVMGEAFKIKIGASCAQRCDLRGRGIEIYDGAGERLGTAEFGEEAWPGSEALHWAEVELVAPVEEGVVSWSVGFSAADLELPHQTSSSKFSFVATKPPKHQLTVEVVESGSAVPVPNAEVSLGVYRASTGESGRSTVSVAEGTYELLVWKTGYEAPARALEVSDDLTVRVEAEVLPDRSSWEDD